jgi:hypothetical protein
VSFTPLTHEQVAALLVVAMAYDNRNAGDATVMAWTEAAIRAQWRFAEAVEAIHQHYAQSTAFLMPGHVTTLIREARRQPAPFAALPPASPASEETRERVMELVGETFALPRDVKPARRPQDRSAEHAAAVEKARAELDALRERQESA